MKAAILQKLNEPLVIEELEIPKLECGQVLVEVHVAGICGKQLAEVSGAAGPDKYLPHLLGHEGAGIVVETGVGVRHVKAGDRVVMHWRKGIGIEADGAKYQRDGVSYAGGGPVHTFAEYAVVSENRLTPIRKDVRFDIAALMGCAVTTGLGIINNEAKLKIGQSIAVIGCGGVGLNVIQGAALAGAGQVTAIDINPEKLSMAAQFGATKPTKGALNETGSYDVVVDCTGLSEVIDAGYMLVKSGGKMLLVGQPGEGEPLTLSRMRDHFCGKTLMGSQGGLTNPTEDIPRYLKLYKIGKLKLKNLITHRFPLDQINEAFDVARSGEAGRVMLEMR